MPLTVLMSRLPLALVPRTGSVVALTIDNTIVYRGYKGYAPT